MSQILISFHQTIRGSENSIAIFYESLAKELNAAGNKVLLLNTFLFQENYTDCVLSRNKNLLISQVTEFSPDLIITFNNQIYKEIIDITNCPIFIFTADSSHFFVNKHYIKQYLERYFMIYPDKDFLTPYRDLELPKNKICTLHHATSIKSEDLEKKHIISFIGSKFQLVRDDAHLFTNSDLYPVLREFWNSSYSNIDAITTKLEERYGNADMVYRILDMRNYILTSLLDLNLTLYGENWDKKTDNIALLCAFNPTLIYSLKQNQDIYNSSKICISISHPQCRGFLHPWRIYDIMASNGLLIASYSKLLEQQTKGIVSIPMYQSPYDARDLCKKYLAEPHLCEDIIAASNEFIEKHGRWRDNFLTLESFSGVKLIHQPSNNVTESSYICIHTRDSKLSRKMGGGIGARVKNVLQKSRKRHFLYAGFLLGAVFTTLLIILYTLSGGL